MANKWQNEKLGNICEVIGGGTPKTVQRDYWDGGIVWVTPRDLGRTTNIEICESEKMITELGLKKSSARILPRGSVILSTRAPIGYLAITGVELATNQGCRSFICSEKLYNKYLYYFLLYNKDNLNMLGGGSTFKEVSGSKLKEITIALPLMKEQKRLVSILDEVFEDIENLKLNAERSLRSAREVFEANAEKIFSEKKLGWKVQPIKEAFVIKPPKKEAHQQISANDLVSFVPMENLGIREKFFAHQKVRRLNEVAGSYTYFSENDVLMAKITPCFENGKIGIAKNLKNNIGFGSSEYVVFRSRGEVNPEFLYYFLNRKSFREEGKNKMSGAVGHKRVSKEFIEDYEIKYPNFLEQKKIVKKLDALFENIKKLELIYKQKIADLDELKKSVLKKAFSGEL